MHKVCFKCSERKPLTAFYKHPGMKDGRLNKCKECTKRDVREHRQKSPRPRKYDRERTRIPERRAQIAANAKRWAEQHPRRRKAQNKLNNAVRDGKVSKPARCERCDKDCSKSGSLHGHHADYSKPLDVEWLCARCHCEEQRKP